MKIFYCIVFSLIILVFYSCGEDNTDIDYYKIRVDSISAADTISVTDTLKIHLFGTIGDNGCYSFNSYEHSITNNHLSLTVWGRHIKNSICPLLLPLLDDIFKEYPVSQGYFYINITQPDKSILKDSCFVR